MDFYDELGKYLPEFSKERRMLTEDDEREYTYEDILNMPISKYIAKHPKKFKIDDGSDTWHGMPSLSIYLPYSKRFMHLSDIRRGEYISSTGRPYIETQNYLTFDAWDRMPFWCGGEDESRRFPFQVRGVSKTWFDTLTPKQLEEIYARFADFDKKVFDWRREEKREFKNNFKTRKKEVLSSAKKILDMANNVVSVWTSAKCPDDSDILRKIDGIGSRISEIRKGLQYVNELGEKLNQGPRSETEEA